MLAEQVRLEVLKADAGDAGGGTGEAHIHDIVADADGLEDLRALVALHGRDPNLGHDLEHGLARRVPVCLNQVSLHSARVAMEGRHGRVRTEGAHAVGAVADKGAEVMWLDRVASLDEQAGLRARLRADEVLVHCAGGEERGDRDPVLAGVAVREDEKRGVARGDRRLRLHA